MVSGKRFSARMPTRADTSGSSPLAATSHQKTHPILPGLNTYFRMVHSPLAGYFRSWYPSLYSSYALWLPNT
jgi:hypothetical protein